MYKQTSIDHFRELLSEKGINNEDELFKYLKLSKTKSEVLANYFDLISLLGEQVGFSIGQSFIRTKVLNVLNDELSEVQTNQP